MNDIKEHTTMATIATPQKRSRSRRAPLIIGGLVVVGLIAAAVIILLNSAAGTPTTSGPPPGWTIATVQTGTIDASISATGSVEPKAEAELRFAIDGTVTEILVQPGQQVEVGQPLARIDDADLKVQIEQAQADLRQAQADYEDLKTKATPEEITKAQAQLAQAQAQYQQELGSVTQADVAAARVKLDQAKTRLARLEQGTGNDSADTAVQQAQANLEQARSELASAKERARLDMEQSANALRNKQADYDRIYWENRKLEGELARAGIELPRENVDQEAQALRDVKDAETAMEQSKIAYETAKQNEIATLQGRESDVREAQTGRGDDLAQARQDVQLAQAELNRLLGGNRSGALAAAQANIAVAEATLADLQADPTATTLAKSEAAVARAQATVKQAEQDAAKATLVAPFAATVARIDLKVGERAAENGVVTVVDQSSFHVDVPVDELDVAQVQPGQTVRVTLDALPDQELNGTVANIVPLATKSDQGTTTYEVTVSIDVSDAAVRPGMTAAVQIVTLNKNDALLVPRRAVRLENGKSYVLLPKTGSPIPSTGEPASERREVTLGLSNNEMIEITSGLKTGEQVLVQDVVSTFNPIEAQ
jgi:RND family efflux transporter MFP subunit